MELCAENIAEYLYGYPELFDKTKPIEITELSSLESDPEAEGFVNFIYRVTQNGKSYILKQARPYLRVEGIADDLPVVRNYLEYLTFILRKSITTKYVPEVYFVDAKNSTFLMEDMRTNNYRVMRFQLNEGREFNNFPSQIGEFIAKNQFYTSELYMDNLMYRTLQQNFTNAPMREIMENLVLRIKEHSSEVPEGCISPEVWELPDVRLEIVKAREVFVKKGECLIHGDLHTSNIFINDKNLAVIDMEYSFIGPFSYDLGYLTANFISQYSAFTFNEHFSKEKRASFKTYLIASIQKIFECYFDCFRKCFNKEAKLIYRETDGYLECLFEQILQESCGFMSLANMSRVLNFSPFPDFDSISSPKSRQLAKGLSLMIDLSLLMNRNEIKNPEHLVNAILAAESEYVAHLD